jgi:acetyl-CoA acetyltransferase
MNDVAIIGIGMHQWGKFPEKPLASMLKDVVDEALKDAGVSFKAVEGIVAGSSRFSGGMGWGLAGNEIAQLMCRNGIPIYNLSSACATGANAFNVGYNLVASGSLDMVLAVAGEKMPKGFIPRTPGSSDDASDPDYIRWKAMGLTNPGYWAMEVLRRMEVHGTSHETMARVAVKAHEVGAKNPHARFKKVFTLEDVMNSAMVAYPLRLFEICAVSDGAAAVIICNKEKARQLTTKPIWVKSSAVGTMKFGDAQLRVPEVSVNFLEGVPFTSEVAIAVQKAFEKSGVDPKDLDFIEMQDNTAGHELFMPESWGIVEPGECDRLVDANETYPNGKFPVNPSGGFASFGEATTAMGLFQVAQCVYQLRGQAGANQVVGAKTCLAQTLGLGGNGTAAILAV